MRRFSLIKATIKFKHLYECKICKQVGVGDTRTEEIQCVSAEGLCDDVNDVPKSAIYMPIGWAHGSGGYYCKECK